MNELDPPSALARAQATFAAIGRSRSFSRERKLFRRRRWWLLSRDYESLWTFADAWSSLSTLGSLPDQHEALVMLEALLIGLRSYGRHRDTFETRGEAGFE